MAAPTALRFTNFMDLSSECALEWRVAGGCYRGAL